MKVELENLQENIKLSQIQIQLMINIAAACIKEAGFEENGRVDIFICENSYIKELNHEKRKIDKETDVLSFPIAEMDSGRHVGDRFDFDEEDGSLMLGDIVISAEMAEYQAGLYGHSLERELAFLTAHGTYHLLGYDHLTKNDEEKMIKLQENILEKFNLTVK